MDIEEATGFQRLTPRLGNVMNTRVSSGLDVPESYAAPERRYPLSRRRFQRDDAAQFMETYVDAVGATFAWLNDFDNYPREDDANALDIDFAQATWLTVYTLLVTQFGILESQEHFARKISYYDSLELLSALVTSNSKAQAAAWLNLASDAFARVALIGQLSRYGGGFGSELSAAVGAIRDDAACVVESGLIYPKNSDGTITVPSRGAMTFGAFEPALYRALRNTRHGFAIRDADILSIHTGAVHNDLPDLSVALFLGMLMDKAAYPLSRT